MSREKSCQVAVIRRITSQGEVTMNLQQRNGGWKTRALVLAVFLCVCRATFAINPPTIISPGGPNEPGPTIPNLTPTMTWTGVSGATRYGMAISKAPYGSGNIVYIRTDLTGTSHTLPAGTLVTGLNYRWNMTSFDSGGGESGNSNTLYFNTSSGPVSPPTIISPGGRNEPGTTIPNLTPTMTWTGVSGATRYGMAISKAPYGSGNIVYIRTDLTGTSHTLPAGTLVTGLNYRWNMTSFNSSGVESGNS